MIERSYGNHNFGLTAVFRNIADPRKITRRYIRFIIRLMGYQLIFEFRFRNSI